MRYNGNNYLFDVEKFTALVDEHAKQTGKSRSSVLVEIGKADNISRTTIDNWIKSKNEPSPELLEKVMNALGVSVEAVLISQNEKIDLQEISYARLKDIGLSFSAMLEWLRYIDGYSLSWFDLQLIMHGKVFPSYQLYSTIKNYMDTAFYNKVNNLFPMGDKTQ